MCGGATCPRSQLCRKLHSEPASTHCTPEMSSTLKRRWDSCFIVFRFSLLVSLYLTKSYVWSHVTKWAETSYSFLNDNGFTASSFVVHNGVNTKYAYTCKLHNEKCFQQKVVNCLWEIVFFPSITFQCFYDYENASVWCI